MENLYRKVKEFQNKRPLSGSDEMKRMVNEIIMEYDAIDSVILFKDDSHRKFQISLLKGVSSIKEKFAANDFDALSKSLFLYGLSLFNQSELADS